MTHATEGQTMAPSVGRTIRQMAEEDLDEKMRAVLDDEKITSNEKIKKYDALLRHFLTLIKQDELK